MPRTAVDRGKVTIKKPGRMRWVQTTGSKSDVVADGVDLYYYLPSDKLVQITPLPKDDQASRALLLLTGRGNITRDFVSSLPTNQPGDEWHLLLKPKVPQADFTTLTLAVDRTSFQLRGLVILDDQGGTRIFRFSNLRENQGVPDSAFQFQIPKGVEIRR